MMAISLGKGWWIFTKAFFLCKPWKASHVAEWMFHLNVTARNLKRHPIVDEIYRLKDAMIKHLYQSGYCFEVKLHKQTKECWSCDGTGEYWTGEECYKCNGTGIFSVTYLYAFRFHVDGRRYAWHQLKRLVDYPVVLTEELQEAYNEPQPREEQKLGLADAWLGSCIVWWWLLFHGVRVPSLLFSATHMKVKTVLKLDALRMTVSEPLIAWWRSNARDDPEYMQLSRHEFEREYLNPISPAEDDVPF